MASCVSIRAWNPGEKPCLPEANSHCFLTNVRLEAGLVRGSEKSHVDENAAVS
jgi:hypothetical protein